MEKEANWKFIVYCTINLVNGKIYVGVHKTNTPDKFDGYIGNGVYTSLPYTYKYSKTKFQCAINKYGINNFKRYTLAVFNDEESAYTLEEEIVNEEFLKREDVYNMILGGISGMYNSEKIKVYQYDLDGNYLAEYASFADAGLAVNKDYTLISYAVRKKAKGANSFWSTDKVKKLNIANYNKGDNHKIPVFIYSVTGAFIELQSSQTEAGKKLKVSTSEIREAAITGSCLRKQWYISYVLADSYDKARAEYIKNRPVFRYTSEGSFDKEYQSQSIAEKENPDSNISKAIRLKSQDSKGFFWSLNKLKNFNVPVRGKSSKRKVGKFNMSGELVFTYDSATAAAKENGTSVWKVLSGVNKTHKNHTYSYI